jgi:uncharacterized protein
METRIDAGGAPISLSVHGTGRPVLVLGHGAGGTRKNPWLVRMAEGLSGSARRVVLYNFPYTESGRKAPDRPDLLEATVGAVAAWCRDELRAPKLTLGGKSMGGRIASQAVAKGLLADALVFLGYPLHPPGQPDKLRDAHLDAIKVPMLFLQGTRDAFATWDKLTPVLARLPLATLHAVEQGDHGFAVPRKTGRTAVDVERECVDAVNGWLAEREL